MGIATYRSKGWDGSTITDKNNYDRGRLKIRPKKKRFKKEEILSIIRERIQKYIQEETNEYNKTPKSKRKNLLYFYTKFYFAEDFALEFNVPCHIIEQCFAILNREGLLHLPIHDTVHDGKRDMFFSGNVEDWIASKYFVRLPFSFFKHDKKHDPKRKKRNF